MMVPDYATGRGDRNLKRGARCATGSRVALARGPGACRVVREGVDAGAGDRRRGLEVIEAREVLGSVRTTRTCASLVGLAGRTVSGVARGSGAFT